MVDDDDGDLAAAEIEQPVGDGLVVHAFVFINAGGQGAEVVQNEDFVAELQQQLGEALAVTGVADVEAVAMMIEDGLVVEDVHAAELQVQTFGALLNFFLSHLAINVEHGDVWAR